MLARRDQLHSFASTSGQRELSGKTVQGLYKGFPTFLIQTHAVPWVPVTRTKNLDGKNGGDLNPTRRN